MVTFEVFIIMFLITRSTGGLSIDLLAVKIFTKSNVWQQNILKQNTLKFASECTIPIVMKHIPYLKMQTPFLEALRPLHGQIKSISGASKSFPNLETIQSSVRKYAFYNLDNTRRVKIA